MPIDEQKVKDYLYSLLKETEREYIGRVLSHGGAIPCGTDPETYDVVNVEILVSGGLTNVKRELPH